ncbi:MAG: EAL domain-containing protein [Pseudomonadales bacterium]|nr:EAL domain-containing protein [Pseudomonadales bacterium]
MNNSDSIISLKDLSGHYEFINSHFEHFYQVTTQQVLGKTDAALFTHEITEDFHAKDLEVAKLHTALESEDIITLSHQPARILHSIRFPLLAEDGEVYSICTQSLDVTLHHEDELRMHLAEHVFNRAGVGILVTDAKATILTVNDAFIRLTGFTEGETLGKNPQILASGKQTKEIYQSMWAALLTQGWWQGEIWNRRKNGEIYPEWLTITSIKNPAGKITNYVGIFSDFTAVIESKKRIEFLATHDELTGLPNRSLFLDRVHQAVTRASRSQHTFAIFYVDLDDFKIINDTLGHAAGDNLLIEVTHRMRECLREGDTIARFGGDEFAILLEDSSVNEADMMASRIAESLKRPHDMGNQKVYPSASVGICFYPNDGSDAETLLKNADSAMYRAKGTGKHHHYFFTDALRHATEDRLSMEHSLRKAADHNQLFLLFQPQVDINNRRLVGVESLVRWNHPEKGLLQPQQFIPQAELSGLIDPISAWAAVESCQNMARWMRQGIILPGLSINVCGDQLRSFTLVTMMRQLILELNLNASTITLEFTETALMRDIVHAQSVLRELKSLGLRLSIDDFGTGYSSLIHLQHFALDEIKIAQIFVKDLALSPDARIVAQTVIAIAKSLGIAVIAEGIENHAQLQILQDMGCIQGQGYLFAEPIPGDELVNRFIKR